MQLRCYLATFINDKRVAKNSQLQEETYSLDFTKHVSAIYNSRFGLELVVDTELHIGLVKLTHSYCGLKSLKTKGIFRCLGTRSVVVSVMHILHT